MILPGEAGSRGGSIHTGLVHAWVGPLAWDHTHCAPALGSALEPPRGNRHLLSCGGTRRGDANGISTGLKHRRSGPEKGGGEVQVRRGGAERERLYEHEIKTGL